MKKTLSRFVLAYAFASLAFVCLPIIAFLQSEKTDKLAASPQTINRPDILWMRGGHHLQIYKVIYTSDNQKLITLNPNTPVGDIKIWRLSDGMLLRTITFESVSAKIDLAPDNQTLAILNFTQSANAWQVLLYDINTGSLLRTVTELTTLTAEFSEPDMDFSPDGNTLLAGKDFIRTSDGVILRSLPSGSVINQYPSTGIQLIGNGKSFSPGGNTILASARSFTSSVSYHTVELNASNFQLVRNFNEACFTGIKPNFYAFSPNGAFVYGSDGDSTYIKNLSNGNCTGVGGGNFGGYRVASSPNGQLLAVSTITSFASPATIRVFDMTNPAVPNLLYQFQSDAQGGVPPAIDFSPDNSLIASGGSLVKLWNVSDGSFNRQISHFTGGVNSVAFSTDGQTVATASQKSQTSNQSTTQNPGIKLWNTADGSLQNVNFADSNDISFSQIAYAANGQQLITLDSSIQNWSVGFWNASTGALIRRANANVGCSGERMLVSPNGQIYTVSDDCDSNTSFYNVSDDSLFRQYSFNSPLAFTPDGQSLIMKTGGTGASLVLVNVDTGAQIRQFQGSSNVGVRTGAVSPDGSTLIVGTLDGCLGNGCIGSIYFWNIATGALIRSINLDQGAIYSIAFAPNGQTFSTLSADKTLRIWQTSEGALLETYNEETGTFPVNNPGQIAYSPDSSKLAYGRGDAAVVMARNPYPTNPPATYTISGRVSRSDNSGVIGVLIALSGSSSQNVMTNANGEYSFTVTEGGSYTVTPALEYNSFAPAKQEFNFISENKTANFTATEITYTISGNVNADGDNLSGATISLTGTQNKTTTTDAAGNYTLTARAGGNYTISVYKNGFTFNPASQPFTNLQANQTADFQSGIPLCAPPPSGLIAWYRAENNANDSAGSNNGSLLSGNYAQGKVGQAFNFNGNNQFAQVPNSATFNLTAFSISTWIYIDPAQNANQLNAVISKGDTDSAKGGFILMHDDRSAAGQSNALRFVVYGGTGVFSEAKLANAFPSAGFYNVTATFDGQVARLHLNGVSNVGNGTAISSMLQNAFNVRLGAAYLQENYGTDDRFNGKIDEIQIFNRPLNTLEIQSIYQSGSAGVCTDGNTFTPPGTNGKIAFRSNRTGNGEIFTMNEDGGGQTNVSNNSAEDVVAAWSPNGGKIAFVSYRNNNYDIYLMNADGTNETRLTTHMGADDMPSWSPDGARIIFTSSRDGNSEIYVMSSDGTSQTRVTSSSGEDYFPNFSPDGSRIIFVSNRTGNFEIWAMNADGSNPVNLTNNSSVDFEPSVSPDGSKIAFRSHRSGNQDIWLMNSDGTNPVNLSNNPAADYYPAFSPDGSKIAFTSDKNNNTDIYVMNAADGSIQTRLTTDAAIDRYPSWQRSAVPLAANVNLNFGNSTQAGYTVASALSADQLPALPMGYILPTPLLAYDIRTSAAYSGNITVTFNVPNVPHSQFCDRLRSLHFENGGWTAANNAAPVYDFVTQICTVKQTVSSLSPFVVAQTSAPTAASVSIRGRVLTVAGRGIRNARVTLTSSNGETRAVVTGTFGYYHFTDVPVGETYVISVAAKRFVFSAPMQALTVQEETNEVDFTAQN